MNYYIFDLETQNHESYKRTANPFDSRNWIVAYGWRDSATTDGAKGLYYPQSTPTIDSDSFLSEFRIFLLMPKRNHTTILLV